MSENVTAEASDESENTSISPRPQPHVIPPPHSPIEYQLSPHEDGAEMDEKATSVAHADLESNIDMLLDQLAANPLDKILQSLLASAYANLDDTIAAIDGWKDLVNKHPTVETFQSRLADVLSGEINDKEIDVWKSLVEAHPKVKSLQKKLSDASAVTLDHDKSMAAWWDLWMANLNRFSMLREVRAACDRRVDPCVGSSSNIGTVYFLLLCWLHMLSEECLRWGIEEVDWWPLTTEDDFMKLRPYMVKRDWRCVQPFSISCTNNYQEVTGVHGSDWFRRLRGLDRFRMLRDQSYFGQLTPPFVWLAGNQIVQAVSSVLQQLGQWVRNTTGTSKQTPINMSNLPTANPVAGQTNVSTVPGAPAATGPGINQMHVPLSLCRTKTLSYITIYTIQGGQHYDGEVFTKLKEEYWSQRGPIAQFLWKRCFWLWDLKQIQRANVSYSPVSCTRIS